MQSTALQISSYYITEQLYVGSRTIVYRGRCEVDQRPVVIKLMRNEHPSFTELVQFRNQYVITKNLAVAGVIQPYSLEAHRNGYALITEDFGGTSLSHYIAQYFERRTAENSLQPGEDVSL